MNATRTKTKKNISNNLTIKPAKRWVKLAHYCKELGDTKDAVHARRKKGIWLDGEQTCKGPNGKIYVCPEAVCQWVESGAGGDAVSTKKEQDSSDRVELPTGVTIRHNKNGDSLWVYFPYKGEDCRENLHRKPTKTNIKYAGLIRGKS